MVMTSIEGVPCEVCRKEEAVVLCNGCGKAICRTCRVFDIWCSDCGSGDVKAFCHNCNDDPEINVYKGPAPEPR